MGGASLADAGFSRQHHQTPLACESVIQGRGQLGHLPLTADEYTACIAIWRGIYHVEISVWDEKEGVEFKDVSDMRPV